MWNVNTRGSYRGRCSSRPTVRVFWQIFFFYIWEYKHNILKILKQRDEYLKNLENELIENTLTDSVNSVALWYSVSNICHKQPSSVLLGRRVAFMMQRKCTVPGFTTCSSRLLFLCMYVVNGDKTLTLSQVSNYQNCEFFWHEICLFSYYIHANKMQHLA